MSDEDGLQIIELKIDGMNSEACILAIKSALENNQGIDSVKISIGSAEVAFQQYLISRTEIEKIIEASGYRIDNTVQGKKRKSFIERMVESNKKEFGNKRPNCCDL